MADEPKRERKSYEERMKEAEEEKARKEAKLKDNNLIKEVMNSDIDDDVKVEIIKRLAQKQEPIYIPYVQTPYYDGNERRPWDPIAIYTSSPAAGDPIENQPHSVCESCNLPKTPMSAPNTVCSDCGGEGVIRKKGLPIAERCLTCKGKGYV